jgi:hypothetical protein
MFKKHRVFWNVDLLRYETVIPDSAMGIGVRENTYRREVL